MDVHTHSYGWANDTFVALDDHALNASSHKWPAFSNDSAFPQSASTIPPSLLSNSSIERYGQITPPQDLFPASPRPDSVRETSISLEQLKSEPLFPEHQLQALQDYRPPSPNHSPVQAGQGHAPKRRRTSRPPPKHAQPTPHPTSSQPQQEAAPQPPKRKRGRPKSQPQMVEAYTPEGFPIQLSAARQNHLEKNRVAAHKCRMRKKDYINGLEERARNFTTQNKLLKENVAMLREEVLKLKNEVLRHAGCGFWAVDEYLARCAGDLLGVKPPAGSTRPAGLQQVSAPAPMTLDPEKMLRRSSAGSVPSSGIGESPDDDYGGFDMLENMDKELDAQRS